MVGNSEVVHNPRLCLPEPLLVQQPRFAWVEGAEIVAQSKGVLLTTQKSHSGKLDFVGLRFLIQELRLRAAGKLRGQELSLPRFANATCPVVKLRN
jgi:hypothetical protein